MPTRKTTTNPPSASTSIKRMIAEIRALHAQAAHAAKRAPEGSQRKAELLDAANHLYDAADEVEVAGKLLRPATARERAELRRLFRQLDARAASLYA